MHLGIGLGLRGACTVLDPASALVAVHHTSIDRCDDHASRPCHDECLRRTKLSRLPALAATCPLSRARDTPVAA